MKAVFIPILNGYEGGSLIISDHSENLFPLHVVSWGHLYSATEYVILPLPIKVRFFLYHMLILIWYLLYVQKYSMVSKLLGNHK